MTNGELRDYLNSLNYRYERDSEHNRDVYTDNNFKVDDRYTKLEVVVDYYTAQVVWWYAPNKKVDTSTYLGNLDKEVFQLMINSLIENNKLTPQIYIAYTDGSALNTHPLHPGGAAYIIFDSQGNEVKRMSKGFKDTTSNRMELLAIISVVNSLPNGSSVTIHTDSQYSLNVLRGSWRASINLDQINLYRKIVAEKNIKVTFNWVQGHNGNEYNELCDQMARAEYAKMLPKEEKPKKSNSKQEGGQKSNDTWTNKLEEQYYNCITTKGRKKRTKKK